MSLEELPKNDIVAKPLSAVMHLHQCSQYSGAGISGGRSVCEPHIHQVGGIT